MLTSPRLAPFKLFSTPQYLTLFDFVDGAGVLGVRTPCPQSALFTDCCMIRGIETIPHLSTPRSAQFLHYSRGFNIIREREDRLYQFV
ncbi:hypothetical protein BH20CHL3_BH20CHL3_07420 [soil metagenome]